MPSHTLCTLQIKRNPNNARGFFLDELTKQQLVRGRQNLQLYIHTQFQDHKQCFDFGYVPHPELPEDAESNVSPVEGFNRWPDTLVRFSMALLWMHPLLF